MIKRMEKGEKNAQRIYGEISESLPEAKTIVHDEEGHEAKLIGMINEERVKYTGAIVRGFNDALTELIGILAGITFILGNPITIGIVGLIAGITAALAMAGSEYYCYKSRGRRANAT
jgi:VIT1/CCC1 family predicted Fe2+/Mn2+ transporter